MNYKKMIPLMALAATMSACGEPSNFEWFPKVDDTFAPTVSASIAGKSIFNNSTTHVSALPQTVTFSANEPATIYYTTNGSEPTTTSASVNIATGNASTTGPEISITNTVLKFFGIDKATAPNQSATVTGTIKSP